MSAGLVVQHVDVDLLAGSRDPNAANLMADPRNYWNVRSAFDLGPDQQLDLMLRHVGKLGQPVVPAYTSLDVRYGWHLYPGMELSLLAKNLFDRRHAEFGAAPLRSEYERSLQVKLLWRL
jgi:iron complex outermembrane recepter protein